MDLPQFALPNSHRIDSSHHPLWRMARVVTTLGAALVLCLCVIVVIRGWLGAFEPPASSLALVLAAVIAELLASVFRIVWLLLHPDATRRSVLLARLAVPSVCVVCVAVALSMTGANGWTVGSLWLAIAGGEFAWWYPQVSAWQNHSAEPTAAIALRFEAPEAVEDDETETEEREELAANFIQQITRSRNDNGVEVISGLLRAEFAAGERSHNLHVAFCPPLAYEPTVIAHQLDGSPLTIKVAQSEVFGARIELRRGGVAGTPDKATIFFEVQPRESANFASRC